MIYYYLYLSLKCNIILKIKIFYSFKKDVSVVYWGAVLSILAQEKDVSLMENNNDYENNNVKVHFIKR